MSCSTQQKPLWRSSLRRHASSVAQDVCMAVWRLEHVTNSRQSINSMACDTVPRSRVPHSATQTMLRANELQHATGPCGGHRCGDMQALLLRTWAWLFGDSGTSPAAARTLAVLLGKMPSHHTAPSVTQTSVRANELQHATGPCGGHRCGDMQALLLRTWAWL